MSINSLTNAAIARRHDFAPAGLVPTKLGEIALAAVGTPAPVGAGGPPAAPAGTTSGNSINTAMNVLFGYIPTEVVTLYVAAIAAAHGSTSSKPQDTASSLTSPPVTHTDWVLFFVFLVATPLIVWIVFATKLKTAGKSLPLGWDKLPVWEMSAAAIAYVAWAFALPQTPFRDFTDWYTTGLGTFAVLLVSTILGLLAPLFQRKLGS